MNFHGLFWTCQLFVVVQQRALSVFKLSSMGQAAKTSASKGYSKVKLREKIELFLPKELWLPSSPDLNPVYFSVSLILESKECNKNYKNVADLTKAFMKAWDEITPEQIRKIFAAAPRRIKAVVQNNGGKVE